MQHEYICKFRINEIRRNHVYLDKSLTALCPTTAFTKDHKRRAALAKATLSLNAPRTYNLQSFLWPVKRSVSKGEMKMLKKIAILCVMVALTVGGIIYGYKLGLKDSSTIIYFSEMGHDYAHLKILNYKGADNLKEFIEKDLDSVVSIYKNMENEETILSQIIGPERDRKANRKHYLSYYQGIYEYKRNNPSEDKESKILSDLEHLINQLEHN